MTGLTVKNLKALNVRELSIAKIIPINIEKVARKMKEPIILNGVMIVNSFLGPE
jgi:hypothetical protein